MSEGIKFDLPQIKTDLIRGIKECNLRGLIHSSTSVLYKFNKIHKNNITFKMNFRQMAVGAEFQSTDSKFRC
jgi:hypothetical protein